MDFKGIIIFVCSVALINVNQYLTTIGLILNITYVGYQLIKNTKND